MSALAPKDPSKPFVITWHKRGTTTVNFSQIELNKFDAERRLRELTKNYGYLNVYALHEFKTEVSQ